MKKQIKKKSKKQGHLIIKTNFDHMKAGTHR